MRKAAKDEHRQAVASLTDPAGAGVALHRTCIGGDDA